MKSVRGFLMVADKATPGTKINLANYKVVESGMAVSVERFVKDEEIGVTRAVVESIVVQASGVLKHPREQKERAEISPDKNDEAKREVLINTVRALRDIELKEA